MQLLLCCYSHGLVPVDPNSVVMVVIKGSYCHWSLLPFPFFLALHLELLVYNWAGNTCMLRACGTFRWSKRAPASFNSITSTSIILQKLLLCCLSFSVCSSYHLLSFLYFSDSFWLYLHTIAWTFYLFGCVYIHTHTNIDIVLNCLQIVFFLLLSFLSQFISNQHYSLAFLKIASQ